jgi:Mycobacterium membrane protein
MSGPNPPGRDLDDHDFAGDHSDDVVDSASGRHHQAEIKSVDADDEAAEDYTGQTDIYSRAYSAPESEQFISGRYVPAELYDYDDYDGHDGSSDLIDERAAARWPWAVGVAAILAAIALVVAVTLLVTRNQTDNLAVPGTTTSATAFNDEITTTRPSPPPPPSTQISTSTETQTVTVTPPPSSAPPVTTTAPPPVSTTTAAVAPPIPTTTKPAGPRQVTYSVTGSKAPGDFITVTYVDASGRRRTQHNVYIPWSMTVTPISQSDVGSVEASSLFRISKLNCSITTSDGTVLSANANDAWQTSC